MTSCYTYRTAGKTQFLSACLGNAKVFIRSNPFGNAFVGRVHDLAQHRLRCMCALFDFRGVFLIRSRGHGGSCFRPHEQEGSTQQKQCCAFQIHLLTKGLSGPLIRHTTPSPNLYLNNSTQSGFTPLPASLTPRYATEGSKRLQTGELGPRLERILVAIEQHPADGIGVIAIIVGLFGESVLDLADHRFRTPNLPKRFFPRTASQLDTVEIQP